MTARGKLVIAVGFVSAVIAILAGDIFYWYHLQRRTSPAASKMPRVKWTATADQSIVWTRPTVGRDGTLYVAAAFGIFAFDPSSARKWVYRLDQSDPVRTVALAQDAAGNLYFTTWKSLYSLFPSGLKRWQANCPNAALARNSEATPFQSNALYVSCDNHLVALNEDDGREIWRLPNVETQAPGLVPSAPLMLHNGDFVFSRGQQLFAADRQGNQLWTYPPDHMGVAYLLGVGPNDTMYAENFSSELIALNPAGELNWTFDGGRVGFTEPPVTAINGTVYAVSGRGRLFSLTSDGALKWSFNLPPSTSVLGYTPPVLAADGAIYQALEGRVIALSPERKVLWEMPLPSGEPGHRTFLDLAPDGTLYAVTDNSYVYAIQTRNEE